MAQSYDVFFRAHWKTTCRNMSAVTVSPVLHGVYRTMWHNLVCDQFVGRRKQSSSILCIFISLSIGQNFANSIKFPLLQQLELDPPLPLYPWIHVGQPACQVPHTRLSNWHGSMTRALLGFRASMCCFFAGLNIYTVMKPVGWYIYSKVHVFSIGSSNK